MGHVRVIVEAILRGAPGAPRPSIDHGSVAELAKVVLDACGVTCCASPYAVADALGRSVTEADLPPPLCLCVDEHTIFVRPEPDLREHGLLVFRGLARQTLARHVGAHTEADSVVLAAELAAPSALVVRRGIDVIIPRQRWAPVWFLRAWDEYVCPPISATRIA